MNRKGQYLTTKRFLAAFKTLFIITIGIFLVLYTLGTTSVDERKVQDIRQTLYAEQLLNNPACFAYEQPTGRVDHAVIDAAKLDQAHLDGCTKLSTKPPVRTLPAKVTILDKRSKPSELYTTTWKNELQATQTYERDVYLKGPTGLHPATIIIQLNPW